jgi:hypothetical protein
MPNFRRGPEAIQEAVDTARSGGGEFRPFIPSIYWKDGDTKYVLILNPIDDIPRVQLHGFLPLTDGRYDQVIARTDEGFGERVDPIEQEWQYAPRLSNLMVAVELEPLVRIVGGYERPQGFEVKTKTFERRIRDDEGELTEDREEVTIPNIGIIAQSPINFGSVIADFAAKDAPIHTTAIRISRLGKDSPTYTVTGYPDQDIDLSNLFDHIEGISYVKDMDKLLGEIQQCETDEDATILIGNEILETRLDELSDSEHYDEVLAHISKASSYPSTQGGKKEKGAAKAKTTRAARPSGRRASAEEPTDTAESVQAYAEVKPTRTRARTRTAEEEVTKESPVPEKLARLRTRTAEIASKGSKETTPA